MATRGSLPTKADRKKDKVPPAYQEPAPSTSLAGQFVRSKLNLLLIFILASLLIVFACVLALVVIPHSGTNSDSDSKAWAVVKQNFPDPCLTYNWVNGLEDHGPWYAFATRGNGVNVQVASAPSQDFSNWTLLDGHDALPHPGAWVATHLEDSQIWAPSVMSKVNISEYVLFYSALAANQTRKHCIGSARSSSIVGPYTALDEPIVCDFERGGVIDPAYFHDPLTNTSYLIYKRDGNAIGVGGACSNGGRWPNAPTPLMAVELDPNDLARPASNPFEMLMNIEADGSDIEAPQMWYWEYPLTPEQQQQYDTTGQKSPEVLKTYHLAYNSGCYAEKDYRINHIICTPAPSTGIRDCTWNKLLSESESHKSSSHGPNSKAFAKNLLKTHDTSAHILAPGGAAISTSTQGGVGDGNFFKQYMLFHADTNPAWFDHPHNETRIRSMFMAELEYNLDERGMIGVKRLVRPGPPLNTSLPMD